MKISSRENLDNLTYEYKIEVFGLVFYRTLYQEQVVLSNYPFWFRLSKWLLPVLCFHEWTFDKWSHFNVYNHYSKEFVCRKCNLNKQFWSSNSPKANPPLPTNPV